MAVDLSRVTFDPGKHSAGVLFEQGRAIVDADLNTAQDISRYRAETAAADEIGETGCPRAGGGFAITIPAGGKDLLISGGRMYVDGILAELTPATVPVTATGPDAVTVPVWHLDGHDFDVNQYVQVSATAGSQVCQILQVDPIARVLTLDSNIAPLNLTAGQAATLARQASLSCQPDSYAAPAQLQKGWYRVYLDVWNQEETWISEPEIREIALGGPDTAGRWRVRAQVKIAPSPAANCSGAFPAGWTSGSPATTGSMSARIDPGTSASSPCLLPPGAGYQGPENQFYRIQIDQTGADGKATLKWHADNASVMTAVTEVDSGGLIATVTSTGLDDARSFAKNDWVEPSDDGSELGGVTYPLQQVYSIPAPTQIEFATPLPPIQPSLHAKLTKWDNYANIPSASANQWITLEGGLQIYFSAGNYQSGDYWLVPARTATGTSPGTIEWPADDAGNALPRPPAGITHYYAPLALVQFDGEAFGQPTDCRPVFPPLTGITAGDVSYDDTACNLGAATVQQAIEQLCGRTSGLCTWTASSGADLERIFNQIPAGGDAKVCLQVGLYQLADTVVISNLGNLTIEGVGDGTRLISQGEAALTFTSCKSVAVRNLHAETRTIGFAAGTPAQHLNGVLTFTDCGAVEVESVSLACPSGTFRCASCLTVAATAPGNDTARIRACNLTPGHQQIGLLAVNQNRITVEDCDIGAGAALGGGVALLDDPVFRDNVRGLLLSAAYIGKIRPTTNTTRLNASVSVGGIAIHFLTSKNLAAVWPQAIAAQNPQVGSPNQLLKYAKNFVGQLLTDATARNANPAFNQVIGEIIRGVTSVASANQGIVIAGRGATEARVVNNTIRAAIQGIHIGVGESRAEDLTGPLQVAGNTINVCLTPDATKGRHGIFVGSCDSAIVEGNRISLQRATNTLPVDAIQIQGTLGRMVIVRHNYVQGFTPGAGVLVFRKLNSIPNPLWLVADNLLDAATPVAVQGPNSGTVQQERNVS